MFTAQTEMGTVAGCNLPTTVRLAVVDVVLVSRWTALHHASCQGRTEMAKVLVAAGADVRCQNKDGYGRTRLPSRCIGKHLCCLRFEAKGLAWSSYGVGVLFRFCRKTALHLASEMGFTGTALAMAADVYYESDEGYGRRSPLCQLQCHGLALQSDMLARACCCRSKAFCAARNAALQNGHAETVHALDAAVLYKKAVCDWTMEDVVVFFSILELEMYTTVIKEQTVDGRLLQDLLADSRGLDELGVTKQLHKIKIKRGLEKVASAHVVGKVTPQELRAPWLSSLSTHLPQSAVYDPCRRPRKPWLCIRSRRHYATGPWMTSRHSSPVCNSQIWN